METMKSPSLYIRLIIELLFFGCCLNYLIKLNHLNEQLVKYRHNNLSISDARQMLEIDNYSPVKFFVGAIVIAVFVLLITIGFFRSIKGAENQFAASIATLISCGINIGVLIAVWKEINNPIVRAIIVVAGIGSLIGAAMNSS